MKFNKKSKMEKIFILTLGMFGLCLCMLCLSGCSGSCFGCNYACESDEDFNLAGISYLSEGCCASSSCKSVIGDVDTKNDDDYISDIVVASCTKSAGNCSGNSSCYTGCFIGKDVDCGDCGITIGSTDNNQISENTIGCVDGCFICGSDDDGEIGLVYELVYYLLGI